VTLPANPLGQTKSGRSLGPPAWTPSISAACPCLAAGRYGMRRPRASHTARPWLLAEKACNSWGGKPPTEARGSKQNDSWQDAEQGFFTRGRYRYQFAELETERLTRQMQLGGGGGTGRH